MPKRFTISPMTSPALSPLTGPHDAQPSSALGIATYGVCVWGISEVCQDECPRNSAGKTILTSFGGRVFRPHAGKQ